MKISLKDWSLKHAIIYFIIYVIFRSLIEFGSTDITFEEYINSKYIFEAIGIGIISGGIMGFFPNLGSHSNVSEINSKE